jgi:hypothetical protein
MRAGEKNAAGTGVVQRMSLPVSVLLPITRPVFITSVFFRGALSIARAIGAGFVSFSIRTIRTGFFALSVRTIGASIAALAVAAFTFGALPVGPRLIGTALAVATHAGIAPLSVTCCTVGTAARQFAA